MRKVAHGVLVAVLSAGVLAGCGDDDPPEPEPTAAPSETTASPSESATPTDEPSPTVEPASGPQETFGSLTLNFPEGYDVRQLSGMAMAASGPDGEHIAVLAVPTDRQTPLDKLVRFPLDDSVFVGKPVRLEDVEVDGVPMYHVRGALGADQTRDLIGVEHGGYWMTLQFTTLMPKAAREKLIDSVLASIAWS
jgi:hypothetical protein